MCIWWSNSKEERQLLEEELGGVRDAKILETSVRIERREDGKREREREEGKRRWKNPIVVI